MEIVPGEPEKQKAAKNCRLLSNILWERWDLNQSDMFLKLIIIKKYPLGTYPQSYPPKCVWYAIKTKSQT
jgi:hypothetical protein